MSSDKRIAANRENAQRSTGPKTTEGKQKSRQNSLKHGLTGEGHVLPDDLAADVAAKEEEFAACAQPESAIERMLIRRMAVAGVRMERVELAESARRTARRQRAAKAFAKKIQDSCDDAVALFKRDPVAAMKQLQSTTAGCRWIARQWAALEQKITTPDSWDFHDLMKALDLLGMGPSAEPDNVEGVVHLRR